MNQKTSLFAAALACADDQPQVSFAALAALADAAIGAKLFTLTAFDAELGQARRIYSNMPEAYPVLGTKTVEDNIWTRQVLERHQIFVANDIGGIAEVFSDFALIQSLGCESVVNIPAVVGGQVLGTINCLHVADYYTQDRIDAAKALTIPGVACFLLDASLKKEKGG